MNNNATKKKLALNKTSLRDLTASEWQMVGGGDGSETATCQGYCQTDTCSFNCYTSSTCATRFCTYGCPTDTCPSK